MTFSFLTFLGPNASVLLSSLSGYIRLLRIPPPSPNHFTLRLSSCCNWTAFDRLPFLFISFPFFLLLTHFYFSPFFSRMQYIQFFAFFLSILCPFFQMTSLNIFLYSPWCLYFAFKDRGGAGKKEERRTKIKLKAVCYRVEGKLSGCRELHPLP